MPSDAQRRVLHALRDAPADASTLAGALGVDPSAVRRHLQALEAAGLVGYRDVVHGRGRPRREYRLTDAGEEAFPRDYAVLLRLVLAEVAERHGARGLHDLLEAIAARIAVDVRGADEHARLTALVATYNGLGFEARVVEDADGFVLEQRNCPFLQVARADPDALCACLDEGIMRAALPGADVTLESTLARRDPVCRHRLRFPA